MMCSSSKITIIALMCELSEPATTFYDTFNQSVIESEFYLEELFDDANKNELIYDGFEHCIPY